MQWRTPSDGELDVGPTSGTEGASNSARSPAMCSADPGKLVVGSCILVSRPRIAEPIGMCGGVNIFPEGPGMC
jgi:hypothetical protein